MSDAARDDRAAPTVLTPDVAGMKIAIGKLELTQFIPEDTGDLYLLRNHASVRALMTNPEPLAYPAHVEWVRSHLLDEPRLLLLLVRLQGAALGFTLLKPAGRRIAEIGVMFREASKHPLIPYTATVVTLDCAFRHLGLVGLVSYVVPAHARAIALNLSFGAQEIASDKPGMLKFTLDREVCLANPNYLKVLARMHDKLTVTGAPSTTF